MNQPPFDDRSPLRHSLGLLLLSFFGMLFVGQLLAVAPVMQVLMLVYQRLTEVLPASFFETLLEEGVQGETFARLSAFFDGLLTENICLLAQLLGTLATIGLSVFWVVVLQKSDLRSMGFTKKSAFPHYLLGLLLGTVLFAAAIGLNLLFGAMTLEGLAGSVRWGWIILFFVAFVVQGASEEILLRGALMGSLRRSQPTWLAVGLNALLFAMLHLGNSGVGTVALLNLLLFGIFASLYRLRTDNIWGICALHTAWNFTQGNVWGALVSGIRVDAGLFVTTSLEGRERINGGAFGPEGGLAVTLVLLLAILLVGYLPRRKTASKNPS
ncbi:MAG: CPBP family intramembrane glutamic endopeptidase [Eubacteriales bacterium]